MMCGVPTVFQQDDGDDYLSHCKIDKILAIAHGLPKMYVEPEDKL